MWQAQYEPKFELFLICEFLCSKNVFSAFRIDGLEKDQGSWGRISDPETALKDSSISIKSKTLIEMVLSTLNGAGTLSEAA